MEITCLQMDILISFYIDGDLSESLKSKVENHLANCPACRAKFNIINSLFTDFKKHTNKEEEICTANLHNSKQYHFFKNNLSAYLDNELPEEEYLKMRKYTIGNKKARKDLEDSYHIRKLMKDSFKKSKANSQSDFSKDIIKNIEQNEKSELSFNPLITVAFSFIISVLLISTIVIYIMSM